MAILKPEEMRAKAQRENAALREWQVRNRWASKPASIPERPGKHARQGASK